MFQFHQNNSQLLFHIIVSLWGAGAFIRDFTTNLARRCRAFTRALKNEKLKALPFPGPGGAGDTNDWCINLTHLSLASLLWDIGKQNSPRCDAASGAILFAWRNFIEK